MAVMMAMSENISIRPLLENHGILPRSGTSFSHESRPVLTSATLHQDASDISLPFVSLSIAQAPSVTPVPFEDIQGFDKSWYESLSTLLVELMEKASPTTKGMIRLVSQVLKKNYHCQLEIPLPILASSNPHNEYIIVAVINEVEVYFHGFIFNGKKMFYLVPGEGAFSINIDRLEQIIEDLERSGEMFAFKKLHLLAPIRE